MWSTLPRDQRLDPPATELVTRRRRPIATVGDTGAGMRLVRPRLPRTAEVKGLAEAKNELGVVRHAIGCPRRIERQLRLDLLDARNRARDVDDPVGDHRAGGAA